MSLLEDQYILIYQNIHLFMDIINQLLIIF